ncbi:hypothetical protein NE619_02160 [Anaerovorax odorimutans]|uniref:Uncharacterized protein n=1 Tax=Anaerovorax odorimutans TaxID=109327 RepID=A0ABT1RK21_9FIRM|nr:hypothetical protein [Anaerovorax odorimutans]MCQ4635520.1 hypothetical protein [Anaerovorax odorimutans]
MKKTVNPGKVKPKMFKCFNIAVVICAVTIALSAYTHGLQSGTDQEPDNSGIKISGGSKKVDWQYESPKVLQITGDDITISGTVTKDLKIECMDASKLTIQDLKRGTHRLDVLAYEDITVDLLEAMSWVQLKAWNP